MHSVGDHRDDRIFVIVEEGESATAIPAFGFRRFGVPELSEMLATVFERIRELAG